MKFREEQRDVEKLQERLGKEQIGKLLREFSVPATIGMLVNALYNVIDRMFIGQSADLASLGLAALSVSFPIMMIMMGLALMFGAGGASLFSIKLGEKDEEGAARILGNGIAMIFVSAFIFMILALSNLEGLLRLFGASEESLPYAMEYMKIILYASLLQGPAVGCNHFMRADGSPKSAMISMFLGAGFNIIFDYIFIFNLHLGMKGAALATIGGQGLSALWGLSYFISKRSKVRLRFSYLRLNLKLTQKIAVAGLPSFFAQTSASFINIILNNRLGYYGGDVAISGMGAVSSLQQFFTMPIIGISHGSQPIIGYNKGVGDEKRVLKTLRLAITAATVVSTLGYLLTRFIPGPLIAFFGREEAFLQFGKTAVTTWFFLLPALGTQIIGALFFQAIGKPKVALFLTLSRQVIFIVPAILLLSNLFGLKGVLYAGPVSDGISFLITLSILIFEVTRVRKRKSNSK